MSAQAAIQVTNDFIDAFNKQDVEALAATLNYPHIRLANGRFFTFESAEHFLELNRNASERLAAEGWDHTVLESVEVVHDGPEKIHLALVNSRRHADGAVYNRFKTLWIATLVDGHWGIQFRSSFLEG